jgi:hypothetical protein
VKWTVPKTSQDLSKPHSPGHSVDPNLGCEVYTTPKTSQPRLPSAVSAEADLPRRPAERRAPGDQGSWRFGEGRHAHGANHGARVDVDHDAPPHWPKAWSTKPPLGAVEQGTSYAWRDRPRQNLTDPTVAGRPLNAAERKSRDQRR